MIGDARLEGHRDRRRGGVGEQEDRQRRRSLPQPLDERREIGVEKRVRADHAVDGALAGERLQRRRGVRDDPERDVGGPSEHRDSPAWSPVDVEQFDERSLGPSLLLDHLSSVETGRSERLWPATVDILTQLYSRGTTKDVEPS